MVGVGYIRGHARVRNIERPIRLAVYDVLRRPLLARAACFALGILTYTGEQTRDSMAVLDDNQ